MTPDAPFEEPWQARAFAMTVRLHEAGHFSWPAWSEYLGRALRDEPERPYWESWLAALEALTAERNLAGADDLDAREQAWRRAHAETPHGQPVRLPDQ
ncbi:MAG: nitrile hydratase accessory protein [Alphaproteobacteria bacterium]|nr:nitrile hydratase accessory protein [Alphaproteobacteria bacterium]